jgi:hypothetical protein
MKSVKNLKILFTLIILTLVVSLMNCSPSAEDTAEDAKKTLKIISKAYFAYKNDIGSFPKVDTTDNKDPGFMNKKSAPAAHRNKWKGPYLDDWKHKNPFGGNYQIAANHPLEIFNRDGNLGNEVWLRITGPNNEPVPLDYQIEICKEINREQRNPNIGDCHYKKESHIWIWIDG